MSSCQASLFCGAPPPPIGGAVPHALLLLATGMRIGQGEKLAEITKSMQAVAEGVLTSRSAYHLAQKLGVDCPVLEGIYKVGSANIQHSLHARRSVGLCGVRLRPRKARA